MKTGVVEVVQAPPQRGRVTPKIDKPPVKMEGYLEKKGKMRVVSLWKRYWFVLEGRLLLYYKSQQEYLRLSPCRGSLNMGLASCVRPGPDRDDGHVLEVVLRAHVVTLRAKDRASQEQWLKALLDSMVLPSVMSPTKDSRTPLHFRYPSADNLSKPDQTNGKELVGVNAPRKEKHRTLPNWKRGPSSAENGPLTSVAEKILALGRHPEASPKPSVENLTVDRDAHSGQSGQRIGGESTEKLQRAGNRGSILSHLVMEGSPNRSRAIHPSENPDFTSPFGNQRYSFHCLRKGEGVDAGSPHTEPRNLKNKLLNKSMENIDEDRQKKDHPTHNVEELVKKQLSYTSLASQTRKHSANLEGTKNILSGEDLKREKDDQYATVASPNCTVCQNLVMSEMEEDHCHCKRIKSSSHEEEKENIEKKRKPQRYSSIAAQYRPDENQNQRFIDDFCIDQRIKIKGTNLDRNHSGSEREMLAVSGIDLSVISGDIPEHFKSVRCTSADTLWSPPRKLSSECVEGIAHGKHNDMEVDLEYFEAAGEKRLFANSSDLKSSQEKGSGKEKKRTHISLRQHLLHGDGEYVKYSDPEDSDKRDSTINTTHESCLDDLKMKPKLRLKKRKVVGNKDACDTNTPNTDSGLKKRASVRNRLSFLSRVLSHVRRSRDGTSESVNDHVENDHEENDSNHLDAELTLPDMNVPPKLSSTPRRGVEHPLRMDSGMEKLVATNFQHGLSDTFPGEAPEEPPPDYDSVTLDSTIEAPRSPSPEQPPQLPPRRMKRPRSPWHDVPTNNSPVVNMDNEARCRLLSAAKHGRVIGTRGPQNMEIYDWSDTQDDLVHHAYEVVSDDDTSPVGSNEHLAIYLSSESSDDEFHEEVVLRRNFQDSEFLSGFGGRSKQGIIGNGHSVLQPLTINTQDLPTLDSSGRVGLSHVEAMKLSLLMQAQKTSHDSAKLRRQEELEKLKTTQGVGNSGKVDNAFDKVESSEEYSNSCVQEPPTEFADTDKNYTSHEKEFKEQSSEDMIPEVHNLLAPVEELLHKFMEKTKEPANGSHPSESIINGYSEEDVCQVPSVMKSKEPSSNLPALQDASGDKPPELPPKTKTHDKVNFGEANKRHSDELNVLLAQLASMTTAPLLPAGATSSLQISGVCSFDDFDGVGRTKVVTSRKQSLSLDAVGNTYDDSEPDYDIPRPHASLMHMLSKNTSYQNCGREADEIIVEATHFFSRPESPRTPESTRMYGTGDHSWTGNISPDSLDLPATSKRPLIWEAYDLMQSEHTTDRVPRKHRVKRDRTRRATLSGPIVDIPTLQARPKPQSIDHNSMASSVNAIADVWEKREKGNTVSERRSVDPKQLELLASTCEHTPGPIQNSIQSHRVKNFNCVSDLCKKFEYSSLEDISERSELERSESSNVRREAERIQNRIDMLKLEEVDYDSLEVTEHKTTRLDLPEKKLSAPLVSIVEEPDVISDKSGKSDEEIFPAKNVEGISSGSASEGALMCEGDSESRASDQQATHATDTDMEMLSDDDVGELLDCVADKLVTTSQVIDTDSLLHETSTAHPLKSIDEIDSTKDASFEADSLEPKK